eukprot:3169278-Rhodomonas_salina.1
MKATERCDTKSEGSPLPCCRGRSGTISQAETALSSAAHGYSVIVRGWSELANGPRQVRCEETVPGPP